MSSPLYLLHCIYENAVIYLQSWGTVCYLLPSIIIITIIILVIIVIIIIIIIITIHILKIFNATFSAELRYANLDQEYIYVFNYAILSGKNGNVVFFANNKLRLQSIACLVK